MMLLVALFSDKLVSAARVLFSAKEPPILSDPSCNSFFSKEKPFKASMQAASVSALNIDCGPSVLMLNVGCTLSRWLALLPFNLPVQQPIVIRRLQQLYYNLQYIPVIYGQVVIIVQVQVTHWALHSCTPVPTRTWSFFSPEGDRFRPAKKKIPVVL